MKLSKLLVLGKAAFVEINSKESKHENNEEHKHNKVKEGWEGFFCDDSHAYSECIVLNDTIEKDGFESSC